MMAYYDSNDPINPVLNLGTAIGASAGAGLTAGAQFGARPFMHMKMGSKFADTKLANHLRPTYGRAFGGGWRGKALAYGIGALGGAAIGAGTDDLINHFSG